METQDLIIAGNKYKIPAPYLSGHVVNEAEAHTLNQTYAENVRNNFAQRLKRAVEKNEPAPTQADLDAYCASYSFGVRVGGTRVTTDPVVTEARRIAVTKIRDALKKKGIKIKSVTDEDMEKMVSDLAARPDVVEAAKAILATKQSIAASIP